MQKSQQNIWAFITFAIAFLVLAIFYNEVLFHPNDYIFAPLGDGIKNYYTYIFHARYDTDFWNFTGMNYPYYEHMIYTDGHPLLSYIIQVSGLADYAIGILNVLMLMSFPVCAFFLYKILCYYGVKNWWSMLAAIAIAFMSPQVYRMTGHLSLSYAFAIPMLWWLIIKCLNGKSILWSVLICAYLLVFFFTHPYLGLILCFFALFFWIVKSIIDKASWKKYSALILIQVVAPIVLFQLAVALTDSHENRLGQPSGFYDYYGSWKSVFISHERPMNYFTQLLTIDVGNWESWNYVGLASMVFAVFSLSYLIRNRRAISFKDLFKKEESIFIIASYLILMFAFCFPLKFDFMRWVVDLFGPLKQFRVLGRFGWVFFYVFTVMSVVGFYRIYLKKQRKIWMQGVFLAGIVFYCIEFSVVHMVISDVISVAKNPFHKRNCTQDMQELIDFTVEGSYDAILFLPFTHMSSENIVLLGAESASYDAMILSYHTGLPQLNSVSSRLSLTESIKFNNFFSPEFVDKELVHELPDSAKILIVKNNEWLKIHELRLVYSSTQVFENNSFKAYNYEPEKWNSSFYFDQIVKLENEATVDVGNGWKSENDSVWFIYESFDHEKGESFGGSGALHKFKGGYDIVYELDCKNLEPDTYTLSFWYYLGVDRPDILAVAEQDSVGDKQPLWFDQSDIAQSTFIVDQWCFVTLDVEVSQAIEKINLLMTGNGNGQPYYMDELLITKANGNNLFRRAKRGDQEYIIYNNYWIKADSFSD